MTFPISRQGLEQIAQLLAVGVALFALLGFIAYRRERPWRRSVIAGGALAGVAVAALGIAYTIAPNIPTPPVPFTARFLQDPTPDTPATVANGRASYQANCVVCHGPQGLGDGPAAFTLTPRPVNLQVHVPQHAPGELYYWVTNGVTNTPMPAWSDKLSDEQRWSLIRYLQALAAGRG